MSARATIAVWAGKFTTKLCIKEKEKSCVLTNTTKGAKR